MTERTILLRKAKWHRARKHWKRARWLESMAFDNSDGPRDSVFLGLPGEPETLRDCFEWLAPGGIIYVMPTHTEGAWLR